LPLLLALAVYVAKNYGGEVEINPAVLSEPVSVFASSLDSSPSTTDRTIVVCDYHVDAAIAHKSEVDLHSIEETWTFVDSVEKEEEK
ncbi:hypothetical protein PFISCL1PPCAC_20708, partial [Pristionchus fissidentatus]